MANEYSTCYLFASKKQEHVQDFREKLKDWTEEPSTLYAKWDVEPSWLGNILCRAGFEKEVKTDSGFCKYRGRLEEVQELREGMLDGERYHYFLAWTLTTWYMYPKMWELILEKHYPKGAIMFAFEGDSIDGPLRCNAELMRLCGDDPAEKYGIEGWLRPLPRQAFKKSKNLLGEKWLTVTDIAEALSEILGREIREEEIDEFQKLKRMQELANKRLKEADKNFFIDIIETRDIDPEDFQ